jgi:acyl-CoA thioesterase-2
MLERLLEVLNPRQESEDVFIGENMHPGGMRVYGGQVLAQAVRAALNTVEEGREIHSQHAYFLRPGDVGEPIRYEVERARDGGSFSSRRVVALQYGKPILVSSMSFQEPSRGDSYQPQMPQVPPPEELVSDREFHQKAGTLDEAFMITTGEDLEFRLVEPVDYHNPTPREPSLQMWITTTGPLSDDQHLHRAMLAYISDAYLIDACLLPGGYVYGESGLQIASLDHALWFHEDFRADKWLLHTLEAEQVGGGRGLARGSFYTRDGRLAATVMQQGVMRLR